jgi:polysaccharide biosynthesis transport protein
LELRYAIYIGVRWWWLFIIFAAIAAGVTYINVSNNPSVYRAQTRLFIGGYTQDPNPGGNEIFTSNQLALTYSNLVTVRPILEATVESLGLNINPGALRGQIRTSIVEETSLLEITVTNQSPVLAASIANEVATQLIASSPTALNPDDAERREQIEDDIDLLNEEIDGLRSEVQVINGYIENNPDAPDVDEQRARRDQLNQQIIDSRQIITNYTLILNNFRLATNTLSVVETAQVPQAPIPNNAERQALIAGIVGLILAGGLVAVYEYFDDTMRSPSDLRGATDLPVLAGIPQFGKKNASYREKLVVITAPNSSPVQAYRSMRTNLLFGSGESAPRRLIVTSSRMGEGKTVTAGNTAAAFAEHQLFTVLIDADFYRPQVHKFFEADNRVGLSSIFKQPLPEDLYTWEQLAAIIKDTDDPNLKIITTGPRPSNPSQLFGLEHLNILCASLEAEGVDMIVFDSPPVNAVVDSLAISSRTDAAPVVVVEAGKTHRTQLQRTIDQFLQIENPPIGIVLNAISGRAMLYQYYYYDYEGYISRNNRAAATS